MRTTTMEYAQEFYSHGEEFRGIHVSMGNVETKYNGIRERRDILTMKIL
jgi:hypothetical protein